MKIVIPLLEFGKGGGHRVLIKLANEWVKLGHEVTYITFEYSALPNFPYKAQIIWIDFFGKRVASNKINCKRIPYQYFYTRYSLLKAINKYAKDADILLANHSLTAFPVYKSSVKARKFYYVQAYEPEYYSNLGLKSLIYKRPSQASYIYNLNTIVNCELYLNYKEIKTNMFVYPGIDLENFYSKDFSSYKIKEKWILGCVGRVEKFKGTQYVIDAFLKLKKQHNDIELHIAFGDNNLAEVEGIRIVYPKDDAELADFYRSVDIIIAPGTVQLGAIHYPVLEAFACGTSVINTGYSKADITNSYIIPINDSDSIVNQVKSIMKDTEQAKSKIVAAKMVLPKFEWKEVAAKMLYYFKN